jgi:hypothetical protein
MLTREDLLGPAEALTHIDTLGTLHRTGGTLVTAYLPEFCRQFHEILPSKTKLTIPLGIGQIAKDIGHRKALGTSASTFSAHPAVKGADILQLGG